MLSEDLIGKAILEAVEPALGEAKHDDRPAPFAAYRDDFAGFCHDILGKDLYPEQKAVADDLSAFDLVACAGANGVGKTALAAFAVPWWITTRPYSSVITTATTWHQVENLLWREVHDTYETSITPLPGRVLDVSVEMVKKGRWYAVGLRSADTEADKFLGHHAPGGVLFIGDEANGILDLIFEKTDTYGTTEGSKQFLISNTIKRGGRFSRICHGEEPGGWRFHRITAFQSPFVAKKWIKQQQERYPKLEKDPAYQITVLAQFPDHEEYGLFPMSLLEMASEAIPDIHGRKMGVDIARGGKDKCVAVLVVNGRLAAVHSWEREIHKSTMRTVAIVKALAEKWEVEGPDIAVDVIGVGGGVVDRLNELDIACQGVDFGGSPEGDWEGFVGKHMKFRNRRAELYWATRCCLETGALAIGRKYESQVWTDMLAITYSYERGTQKLVITPKDDIKKTLGHSPDFADAVALSLSKSKRAWVSAGRV